MGQQGLEGRRRMRTEEAVGEGAPGRGTASSVWVKLELHRLAGDL